MSINPLPSQGALQTGQDFRRIAIVAVKALISIGLITFLATRLDYTRLLSYWSAFNGIWVLGAIAVLLREMSAIAGVRLKPSILFGLCAAIATLPGAFSGSPARRQLVKIPAAASEFDYDGKQQPTQHPFGYGFSVHFIIQPLTR